MPLLTSPCRFYLALCLPAIFACAPPTDEPPAPAALAACTVKTDTVLAEQAVGASWIPWESDCLPDARVAYVDRVSWNVWVMDEDGENKRCLTCYRDNVLGVDFPLDDDGLPPGVHWKGDPEAHPTLPIILFKAENENSGHRVLRNSPSIGWDNDIWALNVCTRKYSRLTQVAPDESVQHSAMSADGAWYVYPLRTTEGEGPSAFDYVEMVFGNLSVDAKENLHFTQRFRRSPLGDMYYEPTDIHESSPGHFSLFYSAGRETVLDPYRYDWCAGDSCGEKNTALAATSYLHEEFLMVSPSGGKLAWMQGPLVGLGYHADLYVSTLDFKEPERVTWYNDCRAWPERCLKNGGQLSRLAWNGDGTAVYFGLWEHGPYLPFKYAELHRLEFAGACGGD